MPRLLFTTLGLLGLVLGGFGLGLALAPDNEVVAKLAPLIAKAMCIAM